MVRSVLEFSPICKAAPLRMGLDTTKGPWRDLIEAKTLLLFFCDFFFDDFSLVLLPLAYSDFDFFFF